MYENEERIKKDIINLTIELRQIQEDKELLQLMIMHQSNKESRMAEWKSSNVKRRK